MLIDASYFVGELNIPDTSNSSVAERLNFFIAKYEEELLRSVLGHSLYAAFIAGTKDKEEADIDQKWKDLRDGKNYTNSSGNADYWMGLRKAATKQSMIANYTYYWWLRDKASLSSAVGEVAPATDGSQKVSPANKMARAWNEMQPWIYSLVEYLHTSAADYTDWDDLYRYQVYDRYRPINTLNI